VGDTPTKKKKSRVQQLGREDDEMSSVSGKDRRPVSKKRKPYVYLVFPMKLG
jgi:inhibitor of growth protein 3